jgi:monoamine oxidase
MQLFRRALAQAQHSPSRRSFLHTSALAAAAAATPAVVQSCTKSPSVRIDRTVQVAVVGAGLAGLHAAWLLKKSNVEVALFEASKRVGGRCLTANNLLIDNSWTELGGEFIDSGHGDMLTLAKSLGVELIDTESMRYHTNDTYYFHGRTYTMEDVVEAIEPFLPRIAADAEKLPPSLSDLRTSPARALDLLSLESYFAGLGIEGWLRSFLEIAFVTENGLELGEQSALNLITMVSTDTTDGEFRPFGSSDERFVVKGGVQRITDALASSVRDTTHTNHVLTDVSHDGTRYVLAFQRGIDSLHVAADHVVLALPFTMLRNVAINVELPESKRRVINELRYGTNGKLLMGFSDAFWVNNERSGTILTDLPLQLVWENSHMQGTKGAGLTMFYGGSMSRVIQGMSNKDAGAMMMKHINTAWPFSVGIQPTRVERMHWPTQPFIKASYSAYGPGQWTDFYGVEGASVGNLHFAGEHCSLQHKGYMNGAAETGRLAAERIIAARG